MLAEVTKNIRGQMALHRQLTAILASRPADRYKLAGDADRFVTAVYESYRPREMGADGPLAK
jgi:hypothetical protein